MLNGGLQDKVVSILYRSRNEEIVLDLVEFSVTGVGQDCLLPTCPNISPGAQQGPAPNAGRNRKTRIMRTALHNSQSFSIHST